MALSIEEKFLLQATAVSDKYDAIRAATGCDYNIFSILGIESKEVSICRIIADLLNPNGLHHQGSLYLKLFAEKVLDINDDDWNHATVQTEYPTTEDRRIDIVIITQKKFIAIEVKIFASEQEKQCEDYYNEAKVSGKTSFLYYLTLNGTSPSEYSRGTVSLEVISWKNHIVDWLEECLKQPQTQLIAPIREILLQLLQTVKKFTNQLEDKQMEEIKSLLRSDTAYLHVAINLYETIKSVRDDTIKEIFDGIKSNIARPFESEDTSSDHKRLRYQYNDKICVSLLFGKNVSRIGLEAEIGKWEEYKPFPKVDNEVPDLYNWNEAGLALCTNEDKRNQFIATCTKRINDYLLADGNT